MDDFSRNEIIQFLANRKFPGYFQLKWDRANRRDASLLESDGQEIFKNIADYIRELRCLSLAEIAKMQSEEERKQNEESVVNKLKRLEASKEADIERFFNWPSQQADFPFWAKADYWTADEAVALSFGRNPKVVNWKVVYEYRLISPFAQEYKKRLILIRRAIKIEALINPIVPTQFLRWAAIKELGCPEDLITFVLRYHAPEGMKESVVLDTIEREGCDQEDCDSLDSEDGDKNPFNPLPTSGIAEIFELNKKSEINLDIWRKLARDATDNGLAGARVAKGKGRAKSLFDPMKVGDWLVQKGKISQAEVNKSLADNLPDRSKDLRHYFV